LAGVAALVSCTKELEQQDAPQDKDKEYEDITLVKPQEGEVVFTASVEGAKASTKVSLGEQQNGVYAVNWVEKDKIDVLWIDSEGVKKATVETADNGPRTSFATKVTESETYWAGYPTGALSLDFDGPWMTIPATTEGLSFDKANMAIAYTTAQVKDFAFKNICGLIRLKVHRDDVRKVVIESKSEYLAGKFLVSFDENGIPSLALQADKSKTLMVKVSDKGEFYVPVSPLATFSDYTVRIYDENDLEIRAVDSKKPFGVARSTIADLEYFDLTDYFVSPIGKGDKNGLSWEDAMSYQQMCELLALNRAAVTGSGTTASGIPDMEGYMELHNTSHALQVDGVKWNLLSGEYSSSYYVRIGFPERGEKVAVVINGGFDPQSTGTDVSRKAGKTYINKPLKGTSRPFYVADYVDIAFNDIHFKGGVGDLNYGGGTLMLWPDTDNDGTFRSEATFNRCSFEDVKAGCGGAVTQWNGKLVLNDCSFKACKATSDNETKNGDGASVPTGGAVIYCKSSEDGTALVEINNCTFENNESAWTGGTVTIYNGDLTVKESVFRNNVSGASGGAIAAYNGSTVTIQNCDFQSNEARKDYGGAIYVGYSNSHNPSVLNISGTNDFSRNKSLSFGGAIAAYATKMNITSGTSFVGNSVSYRDGSDTYGGAIYLSQSTSDANLTGLVFEDNVAAHIDVEKVSLGGSICLGSGTKMSVSSSLFKRSEKAVSNGLVQAVLGGALASNGGTLTLTDVTVEECCSQDQGGVLYVCAGGKVTATGCTFIGNSVTAIGATDHAGGVAFSTDNASNAMTFSRCDFIGNEGGAFGGAIASYGPNLTVKDGCTFVGNKIVYRKSGVAYGGAIYLSQKANNCIITSSTFTDNYALNSAGDAYGGSLYVNTGCVATVSDAVFSRSESNTSSLATRGGAIGVNAATLTLNNSVDIQNCSAEKFGGAIYLQGASTMNADNSLFAKNSVVSGDRAGAVAVYGTSKIYMNQCVFEENVATAYGAAVGCETNKAVSCFFNNCVFRGNNGKTNSNAVYYKGGVLGMNNCTAYNNAASGSDINFSDGTSGTSGIILNSTILSKATNCITNYMAASNAKGVSVLNSIMLCSGKVSTSATGITSSGYNYISTGLTSATGDVVVASGSADLTSFTQVGDNPWFSWNAASVMTSSIGLSEIETEVKKNVSGEAFLTWLKGLTVRTTSGTASNALLYDIAGNSRGESYTPGSFQISE
jgi:hypothetical protein